VSSVWVRGAPKGGLIVFERLGDIRVIRGFQTFRITNRQILRSTSANGQRWLLTMRAQRRPKQRKKITLMRTKLA